MDDLDQLLELRNSILSELPDITREELEDLIAEERLSYARVQERKDKK